MSLPSLFRLVGAALLLLAGVLPTAAQLTRQAASTLAFPADLPGATGYTFENALGSLTFSAPMVVTFPANDPPTDFTPRLFVAERGGTIQCVHSLNGTPTKVGYLNLTSLLSTTPAETLRQEGENGFLSLAFHPNFAVNRTLFVYFSIQAGGELFQRLHQVTVSSATANTATIVDHKRLLTVLDRETNHNGGDIHFGPDGFLYLSMGDEGGGGDNRNNARFINTRLDPVGTSNRVTRTGFWGQLIRIAVEVDPIGQPGVFPPNVVLPNAAPQNSATFTTSTHGNYRVPADNPFHGYTRWHYDVNNPGNFPAFASNTVRTEIWATGLRNPFRWSFDPVDGRLFLGDVGQNAREELNLVAKGDDLGWSWREGAIAHTPPAPTTPPGPPNVGDPPGTGFSPKAPIYDYDRTDNGTPNDPVVYGTTVTGGIVYRGERLPELAGKYLFAEYEQGMVVALTEGAGGAWTGQRLAVDNGLVDFGYDPRNNDALVCDLGGTVKRLVRSTSGTAPPANLTATGVFSSVTNLTPQTGVVPYAPNVDFWSDYAHKQRWFAIKNLVDTVVFNPEGNWTFPTGMVWVKHFDFDLQRNPPANRRKLETRVLVKTATEVYGLSYRWNNIGSGTQSEATLVDEAGLNLAIPGANPAQTWRYPSRHECKACHTPVGGFALSFHTRQLNRTHPYGSLTPNQISALSGAGYFSTVLGDVHTLPAFARGDDNSQSLEWRVRSYLAVNCVQCHQPSGPALGNWDARSTVPTDAAGLIDGALVNDFGDTANKWCVPGDLAHSMALQRIAGNGVPRMPPLATNERDLAAEGLLTAWIMQDLPARQNFTQWQTAQFGSPGAAGAGAAEDPDGDGENNQLEFLRKTSPTVPTLPFSPIQTIVGANLQLSFPQIPNRSLLIETSLNLVDWSLWNVPGNTPDVPATGATRTIVAPLDAPRRFFRARITAP